MAKFCHVCHNMASKTDRELLAPQDKVTYHRITTSLDRKKLWLDFCGLSKQDNIKHKYICSEHFEKKYFERDLKSELLDGVKRMVLSKDAIPTLKPPKNAKRPSTTEVEEFELGKKRKEEVEQVLNGNSGRLPVEPYCQLMQRNPDLVIKKVARVQDSTPSGDANALPVVTEQKVLVKTMKLPVQNGKTEERVMENALEEENRRLQEKILELEQLVEKKNEKINLAKTEMLNITKALQELKDIESRNLNIRMYEVLKDYFTSNQIRKLVVTNDAIDWDNSEIAKAFILRIYGAEAYDYVCTELRYPLPKPEEMEQWIHISYLKTGLLTPILHVMQVLGRTMEPRDKECVLALSKVPANTQYTYDETRDQVIDNSGHLHCICVQGLFSDWHQIIYLEFDLIYTADLLLALVTELHEIAFNVVAITGTHEPEMFDLWNEFDLSPDNHAIQHPKTAQPIYVFTCSISTFAEVYEAIVNEGFVIQGESLVLKDVLDKLAGEKLVNESEESEEKLNRLRKQLEETKVQPSQQTIENLLSHETAWDLSRFSKYDETRIPKLASLLDSLRDWYDLFRTSINDPSSPRTNHEEESSRSSTQNRYGSDLDWQNDLLERVTDAVCLLEHRNDWENQLKQSILTSINALIALFEDLRNKYREVSIPTISLTTFSLQQIFKHFRNLHKHQLASVDNILFQMAVAIADHDPGSMTSKLASKSSLPSNVHKFVPQDSNKDATLEYVTEEEATPYLAKVIANQLRQKYDYLGDQTFVIERKNNSYVVLPEMSDSGVVEPSRLWLEQARKLEAYLTDVTFYRNDCLVEGLVSSIAKRHPKMAREIIQLYVEKRIAIRINNLNEKLESVCQSTVE